MKLNLKIILPQQWHSIENYIYAFNTFIFRKRKMIYLEIKILSRVNFRHSIIYFLDSMLLEFRFRLSTTKLCITFIIVFLDFCFLQQLIFLVECRQLIWIISGEICWEDTLCSPAIRLSIEPQVCNPFPSWLANLLSEVGTSVVSAAVRRHVRDDISAVNQRHRCTKLLLWNTTNLFIYGLDIHLKVLC